MTPKLPNCDVLYDEETYDRVCAERDAACAEADRLRRAMQEAVDWWEGEVPGWCLAGIKDALAVATTDVTHG